VADRDAAGSLVGGLYMHAVSRRIVGAVLISLCSVFAAVAQSWPERPVKVIIPFPPGGATDAVGRPWMEKLTQAFGQPFVIENRGGAGGAIGVEGAVKAAPDGYTLLLCSNSPLVVLPHMRRTPYDAVKQLAPIARLGDMVGGFAVHPSLGVKTMAELIAYAKQNPGKVIYGSAGLGTTTHLRMEVLNIRTGAQILHVPYRGSGDALVDLLAGTVHLMSENVVIPHVKAGKLTLLAMNHHERHWDFPDVPTLRELGIENADIPIWFSLYAPAGTPPEIIQRLNAKIVEIAKTDEMRSKLRASSFAVPIQTPDEIARELERDGRLNGEIIRAANVKLDP
jgi:tripartite-type tricarboxylate transporter receptor subunit TctC